MNKEITFEEAKELMKQGKICERIDPIGGDTHYRLKEKEIQYEVRNCQWNPSTLNLMSEENGKWRLAEEQPKEITCHAEAMKYDPFKVNNSPEGCTPEGNDINWAAKQLNEGKEVRQEDFVEGGYWYKKGKYIYWGGITNAEHTADGMVKLAYGHLTEKTWKLHEKPKTLSDKIVKAVDLCLNGNTEVILVPDMKQTLNGYFAEIGEVHEDTLKLREKYLGEKLL